jgi:ankyrin repeat protein
LFGKRKELLDVRTTTGHGPLQFALFSGNVELVKYLQSIGADIKAVGANNDNALNWAAYGGGKMVEYVHSQGIRPSVSFESRFTPYFDAILAGQPDAMAALKKAGAPINAQTEEGYTPLSYSVRYNDIESAEALIAAGANKDFIYEGRYNMIGLAATSMRTPNFSRIVKHAKSINQAGPDGNTPLHWAVETHSTGNVRWILLNGGDPSLKNKAGLTAKEIATRYGYTDIVNVFTNPRKK